MSVDPNDLLIGFGYVLVCIGLYLFAWPLLPTFIGATAIWIGYRRSA